MPKCSGPTNSSISANDGHNTRGGMRMNQISTASTNAKRTATVSIAGGPAEIDRYDRLRNVNFEIELNGVPLGEVEAKALALPSLGLSLAQLAELARDDALFDAQVETLRAQLAEVQSTHQRTVAAQAVALAEAGRLRTERDSLKEKLANTTGQLDGITKQFDALSRQLSQGPRAVLGGARLRPTATNSTKNIKA